ncbi:SDR family oxidoreductase [Rhodococcus sp. P1Y]|uniref:SDR family oxidoreductase n=1 Tax=Rhodococcus sp. P1Y TaxID=1302308 RepID=UPI000EB12709|nr:SDR family oxidoreductase [Rhodococcus sp. P1Y]AYJ47066.1 SDR family NAD(P)-dependent oxidoreductase [Rhodococcus sp. P1Y]
MVAIEGAVVLVTGGQRGLGKSIVDEFVARGAAKVYATARSPKPSDDARIVSEQLDVTDPHSVGALAEKLTDVTIVVNNAGTTGSEPLVATSLDAVRTVFETNFFGALLVAQSFAPTLQSNGGGALVDIHSALSWVSGAGAYGASKAALWSATNSLRLELAPQGTLVTGVHLGYTDTDMIADLDVPKNDPRDVAKAIADAVEKGETEVLADDVSRYFKSILAGPVEGLSITAGA